MKRLMRSNVISRKLKIKKKEKLKFLKMIEGVNTFLMNLLILVKNLGNEFISLQTLVFLVEGDRTSVTRKIPIVLHCGGRGSKDVQ